MKTFSDRWRQLDWDDIRLRINGKTAADVERALNASQLTRDDMMALLSPAASGYLEQLAQRAQRLTRQRFGNTVSFYVPLYLSNLCANDCTYCGFSMRIASSAKRWMKRILPGKAPLYGRWALNICY